MTSAAATVRVKPIERVVVEPARAGDESADDLPLPPRLPSISALLNETGTQSPDSAPPPPPQGGGPSSVFPPYSVFDPQAPSTYRHDVAPTAPDAAPSPSSSTPALPPPPHYPPVASAHPDTATQAGIAFSQSRPMARPPSPPPRQLTSLEFPDGNALHPLPSGLLATNGGRRRATSASVLPLFEAATPYGRLPGFATSSERGGAGGGAGDGPPDARDQQQQQHLSQPHAQPSHQQDSPASRLEALRPRAFSTPTREEYRAHVGWATALPPVPARAPLHFAARPDQAVEQQQHQQQHLEHQLPLPHPHPHQQHAPDPAYPPMPPYPYYPGVHGPPSHVHTAQHLPPDSWTPHHLALPYPPPPHHPQQQQQQQAPPSLPTPPGHEQPHQHQHQQSLPMPSGLAAQGPASPPLPSGVQQQPQQQLAVQYSTHATGLPGQSAWLPQPPPSLVASAGAAAAAAAGESPQDAGRYGCPHCPKRFARPSSLRIHMHSHTGEKPFTCPMCDRAFSVQSNLRRHLKIHKGGSATTPTASSPTPRSLPRLATDRATLGDAAATADDGAGMSGSTASRPSSGSAGGLGATGTDAEGEGEAERDDAAILEEDEGQGEGEDGDVVMRDEERRHGSAAAAAAAAAKGDELRGGGEAPPLVRTAWPRARERAD
ncbi:uncharacterized protein RHOBADRAFT_53760 [Rhodotorula graminis WP1]|uniref:C2H2-type domain-containing protein n=1 Tax=Rhodotorula graminis (strain WP1) TaxID=578459 RepID=A0A194S262_RHOGW|nr:uncharacterized protein RHOBADRAFT_53760 [Rhodotorula graminis WP1]KPV74823.1 hypothetical protein RHOBADRAFT_53760 [Rhodotorula graminis WP1]